MTELDGRTHAVEVTGPGGAFVKDAQTEGGGDAKGTGVLRPLRLTSDRRSDTLPPCPSARERPAQSPLARAKADVLCTHSCHRSVAEEAAAGSCWLLGHRTHQWLARGGEPSRPLGPCSQACLHLRAMMEKQFSTDPSRGYRGVPG